MVLSELFILILFFLVFYSSAVKVDRYRIFAGHGSWSKEEVYRFPCVWFFLKREGGEIHLKHGHKESYKYLNLNNSPPSGTRTTDLMNTSLTLYQLSYQI